jgi:hypothetical protein
MDRQRLQTHGGRTLIAAAPSYAVAISTPPGQAEALTLDCRRLKISSMNKTQIQVPEELFRELRRFAKQREWSLAETFRRGAELLLQVYPEPPRTPRDAWTPPTSPSVGWKGLTAAQLRDASWSDADPQLPCP